MFERVLVANRGEIAVRVLATLGRMGIVGVALAAPDDRDAPHVEAADITVHLDGEAPTATYLSVEAVIAAARRSGAEAIHPGYGFLSESPRLARACADAGLTFIGPPADAIETMGDKIVAKRTVADAGVPVVPGVHQPGMSDADLTLAADAVGYPLLVKAAAGGGGKGMRVVHDPDDLGDALSAARREAAGAFDDDALLLERLVAQPRHIEIQVLADDHGTVWGLTERECSLQRRHQKVIEESPSPALHPHARRRMIAAAVSAARSCGYRGAGTVEFIVAGATVGDPGADFFFLEMNTRLQVEHPVTELIHDLDLVAWQVRIAEGARLPEEPPVPTGHAVEARVYAEDPTRAFLPTGGTIRAYAEPCVDGVRVDSGVHAGSVVGTRYDPMLAKVIAHAPARAEAIQRLRAGLRSFTTLGVRTNNAFLQTLLGHADVLAGDYDTGLVEGRLDALNAATRDDRLAGDVPVVAAMAWLCRLHGRADPGDGFAATDNGHGEGSYGGSGGHSGWRLAAPAPSVLRQRIGDNRHRVLVFGGPDAATVLVDHHLDVAVAARWRGPGRLEVVIDGVGATWDVTAADEDWLVGRDGHFWTVGETAEVAPASDEAAVGGPVTAPMPGTVTVVDVDEGAVVRAGDRLMVVEAMKMEHPIVAVVDGVVRRVDVVSGAQVDMDQQLAVVEPGPGADAEAGGGGGAATGDAPADP